MTGRPARVRLVVAAASALGLLVTALAALGWWERRPATSLAEPSAATAADVPTRDGRPADGADRTPDGAPGGDPGGDPDPPAVGRSDAAPRPEAGRDAAPADDAPVRVVVPSVGLAADVRPVGVTKDGQMRLPDDPRVLGWYRFGPAPGAGAGSVVVAGHLDSTRFGVGPLVRLREARPGDLVTVRSPDASRRYRVLAVQRFDRSRLPGEVFAREGREVLRLVTCAGAYDPARGYAQNLVVTALPVP